MPNWPTTYSEGGSQGRSNQFKCTATIPADDEVESFSTAWAKTSRNDPASLPPNNLGCGRCTQKQLLQTYEAADFVPPPLDYRVGDPKCQPDVTGARPPGCVRLYTFGTICRSDLEVSLMQGPTNAPTAAPTTPSTKSTMPIVIGVWSAVAVSWVGIGIMCVCLIWIRKIKQTEAEADQRQYVEMAQQAGGADAERQMEEPAASSLGQELLGGAPGAGAVV